MVVEQSLLRSSKQIAQLPPASDCLRVRFVEVRVSNLIRECSPTHSLDPSEYRILKNPSNLDGTVLQVNLSSACDTIPSNHPVWKRSPLPASHNTLTLSPTSSSSLFSSTGLGGRVVAIVLNGRVVAIVLGGRVVAIVLDGRVVAMVCWVTGS